MGAIDSMRMVGRPLLVAAISSIITCVVQAEPPEILLWPDGVSEPAVPTEPAETTVTGQDGLSRRYNVSSPRLFVHVPESPASTARAAVIVVPGGGFTKLADEHEGSDACKWLTGQGIAAFQLAYRTPTDKHPHPEAGPVQDLILALKAVRQRSAEFGVDPNRVGVLGFSAGGQVAFVEAASQSVKIDFGGDRTAMPDALLLIYPWRIWDDQRNSVHSAAILNASFPPVFMAQAADDKSSSATGNAKVFIKLADLRVPVEFHVYANGGHGFGMRPRVDAPGTADWQHRATDWLRLRGFLEW
jgi:acetyl esterase/lipase